MHEFFDVWSHPNKKQKITEIQDNYKHSKSAPLQRRLNREETVQEANRVSSIATGIAGLDADLM